MPPPAIPLVSAQPAPSNGSPSVDFADVLDASTLPAGLAIGEVSARDAAGRRWLLLYEDTDGAGSVRTVQFPDLANAGVPGLQTGVWSIFAEGRLYLSATLSPGELVLGERIRQEVAYARADAASYTVQ